MDISSFCHLSHHLHLSDSDTHYRTMYSNGYPTSTASTKKPSNTMPRGVKHPQAGMPLGPHTQRCECGGVIGVCGTAEGANKWRSHMRTSKHRAWDTLLG
jgi:hypothetical protein